MKGSTSSVASPLSNQIAMPLTGALPASLFGGATNNTAFTTSTPNSTGSSISSPTMGGISNSSSPPSFAGPTNIYLGGGLGRFMGPGRFGPQANLSQFAQPNTPSMQAGQFGGKGGGGSPSAFGSLGIGGLGK